MSLPVVVILAILGLGVLVVLWRFLSAYAKARGQRVVKCPETKAAAGVEVDAKGAAMAALGGKHQLELSACTRWPERAGCGQECLQEIANAPDGCLVREILANWFADKTCVLCGKPLGPVDWSRHKPVLMDAQRRTFEWRELDAVDVPTLLETHQPVCWDCHIMESLVRKHPEKFVERPAH
jgi:hypothetical protein